MLFRSFTNSGFYTIEISKSDTNCVYLFSTTNNGHVEVSLDKGVHFNVVKNGAYPSLTGIDINDTIYSSASKGFILPQLNNSNNFYCGSKIIYQYLSSTGFIPLVSYRQQLPGCINNLYASDNGDTLFACTSGGLYSISNGGQSWKYAMQGVCAIEGLSMDFNYSNKRIFTIHNGVFDFTDSIIKPSSVNSIISNPTYFIHDTVDTNLQFQVNSNLLYLKSWKDTSWINFSNSLPTRCAITDLKIDYAIQPNRLYVLFDGAGIYYTTIDSLRKTKARFTITNSIICNGSNVQIENISIGIIDSVRWNFTGASIQQSNNYNPIVSILNRSNFSVQLIVYHLSNSDTIFFSIQNNAFINSIYELDSCNQFGPLFSDSIIHTYPSNFQWQLMYCDT